MLSFLFFRMSRWSFYGFLQSALVFKRSSGTIQMASCKWPCWTSGCPPICSQQYSWFLHWLEISISISMRIKNQGWSYLFHCLILIRQHPRGWGNSSYALAHFITTAWGSGCRLNTAGVEYCVPGCMSNKRQCSSSTCFSISSHWSLLSPSKAHPYFLLHRKLRIPSFTLQKHEDFFNPVWLHLFQFKGNLIYMYIVAGVTCAWCRLVHAQVST